MGDITNDFEMLAYLTYRLIEGDADVLPSVFSLLKKYDLVDDNEEWIYPDDSE